VALDIVTSPHGVVTCWLNNPKKLNALNNDMLVGLVHVLEQLSQDTAIRAIVIRGRDRSFCAGRDLGELDASNEDDRISLEARLAPARALARAFASCSVPTLAVIEGKAVGLGVAMAAWADIVVASEDATFSVPEARAGIVPSFTAVTLARAIGQGHALALCLTGLTLKSDQAALYGLTHFTFSLQEFDEKLHNLEQSLLKGGPWSLRQCKKLLRLTSALTLDEALNEATITAIESMTHLEATQGMSAFRNKRLAPWVTAKD